MSSLMSAKSWYSKMLAGIWSGVVRDVPPSLEACEACRELNCTEKRWLSCVERLAAEALALCGVDGLTTSVNQTSEMPGLGPDTCEIPEEIAVEQSGPGRRRLTPI
jgi:hypothetical protein